MSIDEIARRVLKIPTLGTRGEDVLDFHTLPVWSLSAALKAAYQAGREAGLLEGRPMMRRDACGSGRYSLEDDNEASR